MLTDYKKDIMSSARSVADKPISHQRRKLIKASAAAVPAVMTLRSGAAAAMGSTYHCTARDNKLAMAEINDTSDLALEVTPDFPHDHWVRVWGKRVTKNVAGGNTITIYCTMTGPGGPSPADAWQCFNEDGTEFTGNLAAATIQGGDDVALLAFLDFDEYGNDTGDPVLYYPIIQTVTPWPPNGGRSPLTGSCLSSIHPNLMLPG